MSNLSSAVFGHLNCSSALAGKLCLVNRLRRVQPRFCHFSRCPRTCLGHLGIAVTPVDSKALGGRTNGRGWPSTSLTALQKCGRYRINSGQTAPSGLTGSAAFDPKRRLDFLFSSIAILAATKAEKFCLYNKDGSPKQSSRRRENGEVFRESLCLSSQPVGR
jgi:hypothetical protein